VQYILTIFGSAQSSQKKGEFRLLL